MIGVLKDKALKKILITSITTLILLILYLIPSIQNEETLKTNLELEYVSGVGTNSIYLLDKNNYLVKTKILLTEKEVEKQITTLINNLIINKKNTFPDSLKGTIPEKTKLLSVNIANKIAILNFSKEFLSISSKLEDRMFESIVFSIMDLKSVDGVIIKIEGETLGNYPNSKVHLPDVLNKSIGINKSYNITNRKDINKVVVYYLENIDDINYYVPVTKYVNDSREKVDIIVENLSGNFLYETNLISLLQNDIELMNYQIEDELMLLNFNNNLFNNEKFLEEVTYQVAYSIFDNYDVQSVLIEVNGEEFTRIEK